MLKMRIFWKKLKLASESRAPLPKPGLPPVAGGFAP